MVLQGGAAFLKLTSFVNFLKFQKNTVQKREKRGENWEEGKKIFSDLKIFFSFFQPFFFFDFSGKKEEC